MNEEKINQIKEQIRSLFMEITSIGEEPPEFIQDLLLQVIEKYQIQINELRQQDSSRSQSISSTSQTPSADAQLLWILSGQNEQAFLQYLTTYPTNETQALLRNPAELQRVISLLNQMIPPGEPLTIDGITHAGLNSSNVWGMAYNPSTRQMKVRFQGGSEYVYDAVSPMIYKALEDGVVPAKTTGSNEFGTWWKGKVPSLGASLNELIKKGGYSYKRIR